jgi:hypothetical protein
MRKHSEDGRGGGFGAAVAAAAEEEEEEEEEKEGEDEVMAFLPGLLGETVLSAATIAA